MEHVSGTRTPRSEADVRTGRYRILFAGVWLVFLLQPLADGWRARDTVGGWVGMISTLAFGVVYVRAFSVLRARRVALVAGRVSWRAAATALGLLVVLGVTMCLSVGESGLSSAVYVGVASVMFLPTWAAVAATLLVSAAVYVVPAVHPQWKSDPGLVLSVWISAFAMWGVMQLLNRNAALLLAEQDNARLAVAEERGRMARDLHDILGHSLTVITVKAELAGRLLDLDTERARVEIADLERLSRDALVDVRRAVDGYRELTLPGELARARSALDAAEIRAELPGSTDNVPSDLREVFAWTIREAVTNVIRHSGATTCTIRLADDRVEVLDDGRGTARSDDEIGSGHGLQGLRERALAAGATLRTSNLQPSGFALTVVSGGVAP